MLPVRGWAFYEDALRRIGEHRSPTPGEAIRLLVAIGLARDDGLTPLGDAYFQAAFVDRDQDAAHAVLAAGLMDYAPAACLVQVLAGVRSPDRPVASTALRRQGLADGLTDRSLASLLTLMDRAGLIEYQKRTGLIRVLVAPADAHVPRVAFVSPLTPYSNKLRLRDALGACETFIHWFDKHFMPIALDDLIRSADGNRIREVRVLSLLLPDHQNPSTRRALTDATKELGNRGVSFKWHTIDSRLVRDTHDRWIIGANLAWNVPNTNAIYSGQNSELIRSDSHVQLAELFEQYWAESSPLGR